MNITSITATELKTVMDDHLGKLVACGDTEALALHLQAQNIKALCGNTQLCALAVSFDRAMTEAFPGADLGISVNRHSAVVLNVSEWVTVAFPRWMTQFVLNFDGGQYPDLMAKNAKNWAIASEIEI